MRGSSSTGLRAAIAAGLLALGLAACGTSGLGHHPSSTTVSQDANAPATAANAEITSAGYTVVKHVPEFGEGAIGINLTAKAHYMGALIMKDAKAAQDATSYFDKHPQTGVTVTTVTTSSHVVLLVIKADSLKDAKAAADALAKDLRASAKSSA